MFGFSIRRILCLIVVKLSTGNNLYRSDRFVSKDSGLNFFTLNISFYQDLLLRI